MKNKLLLILILSTLNLSAQKYDFDKYRYRVNGYRTLNFSGELRGSSYFQLDPDIFSNSNQNRGTGNLGGSYSRFKNSQNHVKNTHAQLTFLLDNIASVNSNSMRLINANCNLSTEDLFYRGNKFFSNRMGFYGNFSQLKQDADQNLITNQIRNTGNIFYETGTGEGRLEYISDPVLANFILKDMRQKGVIENFTPEQIELLAQKISQIQSIRMMDYRYRLIDQINMLDSFLKQEVVKDKFNATYFTTLYDNWLYANRFQRFSGHRNEMFIGDRIGTYSLKQKFETDSSYAQNQLTNQMYIVFEHVSEKAIKLTYQKSRNLRIEMNRNRGTYDNGFGVYKNKATQFTVNLKENFGWYPNTRTFLSTGINTQAVYQFNSSFHDPTNPGSWRKNNDQLTLTISPGINLYYFFSPKLSLNANAANNLIFYKFFSPGSEGQFYSNNNFNVRINYTLL